MFLYLAVKYKLACPINLVPFFLFYIDIFKGKFMKLLLLT